MNQDKFNREMDITLAFISGMIFTLVISMAIEGLAA